MGKIREKLRILADAAKYDASCASSGSRRAAADGGLGNTEGMGICHSFTPDGRCVSLLKLLLTNYCIYDCHYCVNRVSSDTPRARFTPEEVVWLTLEFYKRNYIEGLFLSSGVVKSGDETMAELARVARLLRETHRFNGYIHLKAVPGASAAALEEAGRYADRLSANIELPTEADLRQLAPAKSHAVIERSMTEMRERIDAAKETGIHGTSAPAFAPAGQTTQMIVGATPTSDAVALEKAAALYRDQKLRRVYYSAFSPIPHADPTLPLVKIPLVREHRLYQADWLHRFYGFDVRELVTEKEPNLDLSLDPKTAWAIRNRHFFPVDVNVAPREALLRVPGLGVRSVDRIIKARRFRKLTLQDLGRLRVSLKRAKYFLVVGAPNRALHQLDAEDLKRALLGSAEQLELFGGSSGQLVRPPEPLVEPAAFKSAVTGEL